MDNVRVRFAPSPTGSLHIGGARTALFNWLFARNRRGVFILRLEDTDTGRNLEEAVTQIESNLRWLGLDWDEGPDVGGPLGPYCQSERSELYQREAQRLLENGHAYRCYCTPEELAQQREEARKRGEVPRYDRRCCELDEEVCRAKEAAGIRPALRIKVPRTGTTVVSDLIRGKVSFDNTTLDDIVIQKSNGGPTYNFACVVDDHAMQISHVIRAEEHLSNTPKQIVIFKLLGYDLPAFAHVPMILAPDRSKLSKRHGATAVEEFRTEGFLPEAVVNYLALLGWSPGDEQEQMMVEEIKSRFNFEAVSKHAAIYDVKKLTWLNAQYLNALPLSRVVEAAFPFMQEAGYIGDTPDSGELEYLTRVVETVRSRVHTLVELCDASRYFYRSDFEYDEKGVRKHFTKQDVTRLLAKGREALAGVPADQFTVAETEKAYRKVIEGLKISGGALFHPTRLALSGRTVGPGLFDIVATLGRNECLSRIDQAIDWIHSQLA
ncbi:MAG: glutamate--tRNA ligase [Candidatus Desulforudis sp.]|nr:glutamate--tRNA ligase [Desulforudis sp.]